MIADGSLYCKTPHCDIGQCIYDFLHINDWPWFSRARAVPAHPTPPLICISFNNNSDHCGDCFFLQSTPTYVNDVAVYCPIELIPLLCVLHKRIFLKD